MLRGKGKMLRFECDKCKELIDPGKERKLTMIGPNKFVIYDVCPKCADEFIATWGPGRGRP